MNINYEFEEDYKYEVDYTDLRKALVKILCDRVKYKQKDLYNEDGAYQMAIHVVYDLDMLDALCENLEEDLYDYFYDEAYEQYLCRLENEKAEEDWYGTRNDIQ